MAEKTIEVPDNCTVFYVCIPNGHIELVIKALCDNNGFAEDGESARQVVIQFIKNQTLYYNERMAAKALEQSNSVAIL